MRMLRDLKVYLQWLCENARSLRIPAIKVIVNLKSVRI